MDLLNGVSTNTFGTDLAASVGLAVNSVWILALVALAIPLAFYILYRIIGLFPKTRSQKSDPLKDGNYYHEFYTPEQVTSVVEKIREVEARPGAGYP